MISIRMVKICDDSICKHLKLIFQSCLENGKFPSEQRKANVVPIHTKGGKQILKNYRPITLLPITGKILERLLYDTFEFFTENNWVSDNQSGRKPGDSCVNQLLSIILKSELLFWTYLKHPIRYGIKVLYTNSSKMAYRVTF